MTRLAIALVIILFAGCKKKEEPPPLPAPPVAPKIADDKIKRTQPIDPRAPLQTAKVDDVRVQLDLAATRAAIREYKMLNAEKNPPDIGTLNLKLSFPGDLTYDANSGMVKSRTYPMY